MRGGRQVAFEAAVVKSQAMDGRSGIGQPKAIRLAK
jgi:hypothetical protein